MAIIDEIILEQKDWAANSGVELRDAEHTDNVYDNLYGRSLYSEFADDFNKGDGDELSDHGGNPAKMSSLRSSSALCVNVFAPQAVSGRSFSPIGINSLLDRSIDKCCAYKLYFEDKHSTGTKSPANLDVALKNGIRDYFIESKFMEPYDHSSSDVTTILKQSYLDINTDVAHPRIIDKFINHLPDEVADELSTWTKTTYKYNGNEYIGIQCHNYRTVDVSQLLKHVFGLMKAYRNDASKFMLIYLYYKADDLQEAELKRFKQMLTDGPRGMQFDYISYQDYVARLRANGNNQHLNYLSSRYGL
jgi:hypothetical protein